MTMTISELLIWQRHTPIIRRLTQRILTAVLPGLGQKSIRSGSASVSGLKPHAARRFG